MNIDLFYLIHSYVHAYVHTVYIDISRSLNLEFFSFSTHLKSFEDITKRYKKDQKVTISIKVL